MAFAFEKPTFRIPYGLEQAVYMMPVWQKLIIVLVAFAIPCVAFWFLYLAPSIEELDSINGRIPRLNQEIRQLEKKAKLIPELEQELKEMDTILKKALKLLPESKDIPSILTEISSIGNEEHLEFLSFQPGNEVKRDFYAEIPVNLTIKGPFHNTMRFFDKVSRMPRIVHMQNISMGGAKEEREAWSKSAPGTPHAQGSASPNTVTSPSHSLGGGGEDQGPTWIITTRCEAVTYRFLTAEEQKAVKKKGSKKKRHSKRR